MKGDPGQVAPSHQMGADPRSETVQNDKVLILDGIPGRAPCCVRNPVSPSPMDQPPASPAASPRRPSRDEFDEEGYLLLHPDVAAAVAAGVVGSGWQHFSLHGAAEGRRWLSQADRMHGVSSEIAPDDEMFLGDRQHYFDAGDSALRCIENTLRSVHHRKENIRRILDLPCGHGRVLRFLRKAFPHARLTACDLNRAGVGFCAQAFGADPVVSAEEVAQIRLGGEFDLIWCGSLLTHLPRVRCAAFLELFREKLSVGGVLIFTLHGRIYEQTLLDGRDRSQLTSEQIAALLAEYRRTGFGYVDYRGVAGYGFSLAHPSFVTSELVATPGWRLVGYHERGWDQRQDVIALQKEIPTA
jgi:SAM-dependent methyltransferase